MERAIVAKIALLIGVSEYGAGLEPLPAAERDVAALERVLQNPEIGGFDRVEVLVNPASYQIQSAIEDLFASCSREDLALLYFSGHGIKDDRGNLYFAAPNTQKMPRGTLKQSSAVSAQFVHDVLTNCRVRRQAVILDCCFSGAFDPEFRRKDDGSVDLRGQLGAEGRVVLTSSSATEYSLERSDSDMSLYTRYLVEGFETGAADLNEDGQITAQELHEYATDRVQKAAPAMTPKLIVLRDLGFQVVLAQARIADPRLRYRREVVKFAEGDHIRPARQALLARLRQQLGLSVEVAAKIEAEVFRPYQERLANVQTYGEALFAEAAHRYPLDDDAREALVELQRSLGLELEDISSLEAEIEAQLQKAAAVDPVEPIRAEFLEEMPEADAHRANSLQSLVVPPAVELVEAVEEETDETAIDSTKLEAQEYLNRGLLKLGSMDNQGAIADFSEAIRLNPDDGNFYDSRGKAKYAVGDSQGAMLEYREAVRLFKQYGNTEKYLSALKQLWLLECALNQRSAESTPPPEVLLAQGNEKYAVRDYQGALAAYDEALHIDPSNTYAYTSRGNAKLGLGDKEGAITDYDEAIRLDPKNAIAYQNRGNAKYDLGDNQG
ncbi:MAG: caspase family protein, partial [Nodosilinea sp.]